MIDTIAFHCGDHLVQCVNDTIIIFANHNITQPGIEIDMNQMEMMVEIYRKMMTMQGIEV